MKRTDKTDVEQFYGQGFRDRVNKANDKAARGMPMTPRNITRQLGISRLDFIRLLNALDEDKEGVVTLPINDVAAISVEVQPMPAGVDPLPLDVDRFYAPQGSAR